MGKIRDFREETLNKMLEELVDENADFDGLFDWVSSLSDKELEDDLSNFDEYMKWWLEINDVTREKLKEIISKVHSIEWRHSSNIQVSRMDMENLAARTQLLADTINDKDFERIYDKDALLNQLTALGYNTNGKPTNPYYMGRADFAKYLAGLPVEDLLEIDPGRLSAEQRNLYYKELHNRYASPETGEADKVAINRKLGEMSEEDAMNAVFDPNGQYGGDQGWGYNNRTDAEMRNYIESLLVQFIREKCAREGLDFDEYMAGLTRGQIDALINGILKDMAISGCGYTSIANSIFVQYINNPAAFEAKFGFKMVDSNGRYNIEYLIAYLFFMNVNKDFDPYGIYSKEGDEAANLPPNRVTTGGGGSANGRADYLERLEIEGLSSNGKQYAINLDKIRAELAQGHKVVLGANPCVIYQQTANGEKANMTWKNARPSAHAMMVTGVRDNGDLVVSSWGGEWYIKASELGMYGQTHTYLEDPNDSNSQTKSFTGSISYEVYK